ASGAGGATAPSVLRPPVKDGRDDRGVRVGTPEPVPSGSGSARDAGAGGAGGGGGAGDWQSGFLRHSALTPDGLNRQLYILESQRGEVILYLTAGPGVSLSNYLGKKVEVYGSPGTAYGLKRPYMVATAVEPMR
ncbi:MAG: hypothetical protein K2V38_17185, partial [Gemmataceae bacterium]|nr:hypothetical protein [Gemmataceae bacterium]